MNKESDGNLYSQLPATTTKIIGYVNLWPLNISPADPTCRKWNLSFEFNEIHVKTHFCPSKLIQLRCVRQQCRTLLILNAQNEKKKNHFRPQLFRSTHGMSLYTADSAVTAEQCSISKAYRQ